MAIASAIAAHGLETPPARLDGAPIPALDARAIRKLAGARVRPFYPWGNYSQNSTTEPVVGVIVAPTAQEPTPLTLRFRIAGRAHVPRFTGRDPPPTVTAPTVPDRRASDKALWPPRHKQTNHERLWSPRVPL